MNDALNTYIENQISTQPIHLIDNISYKGKKFNYRTDFKDITYLIEKFLKGNNINRYLILPGLRDVGKSTILFQTYNYLLKEKNINPKNILYLSAENLKTMFNTTILEGINSYLKIFHNAIPETLNENIFLLIDEAQYDKNWSLTGKIIFDSSKKIFMIFTGSSALELEYNADSARRLLKIPINPLNYSQHSKLKYNFNIKNASQIIHDLIFKGEIKDAIKLEQNIIKSIPTIENYDLNEWDEYLQFGGFPSSFYQNNNISSKKLIDTINRVISVDMVNLGNISYNTQNNTFRLLYFLALQKPGEISHGAIAEHLECHTNSVKNIIDILEKTHLLFHIEPYSSSPKRRVKPFKYFFATPSLKHALSLNLGIASSEKKAYKGGLLENLVASNFYNLKNRSMVLYNIYYDPRKKKNADFLVQRGFDNPIPIEVSIGKKNNSQIKSAIHKYKSDYGIIISNTENKIKREDNIIHISPKLFSLL